MATDSGYVLPNYKVGLFASTVVTMNPFSPAVGQANYSFVSISAVHLMSNAGVFFP